PWLGEGKNSHFVTQRLLTTNYPLSMYDFLALGDTVTDAFIRLKDAQTHCNIKTDTCELCVRFGDKVPYESVQVLPGVGNPANAAVAAARLELKSGLVTDLGDDREGDECAAVFEREKVAADFVRRHKGMKTNYHYVLWYEADRTILVKHEEYPYAMADIGEPRWLYFSSLAQGTEAYHDEIADYLEAHPAIKLAFQPNTFQILESKRLSRLYQRAEVVACNVEEAQKILKTDERDLAKLLDSMHTLGPKIVLITDGPKGAYASDVAQAWFMPPYPDPAPPVDRTGAGDAFASTFVAALALGEPLQTALAWAPINSMSVVQKVGAQEGLLTRAEIQKWLASAPGDYQPKEI
ncbi:MAG: hypothetical protein COV10_04140, partial [Candidatus Vogelbacteria bacterium CG10_big_fil_rev_8_21_14_0_10_51_16]